MSILLQSGQIIQLALKLLYFKTNFAYREMRLIYKKISFATLVFFKKNNLIFKKKKPAASPSRMLYTADYQFKSRDEILALFSHLNIEYNSRTCFSSECQELSQMDRANYIPYRENKLCFDRLSHQYAKQICEAKLAPMYIKWVNDKIGYGCYAAEDIAPVTLLGEYAGQVRKRNDGDNSIWSWNYPPFEKFSDPWPQNLSVHGDKIGNELRFMNHSDTPNCESLFVHADGTWCIIYVATRMIQKNEEILISYGQSYWNSRKKVRL